MTHDTETQPEYLTCAEVAVVLRFSAHTVRRMCRSGELPAVEVGAGRRLLIPAEALTAYLHGRTLRPDPQPAPIIPGQMDALEEIQDLNAVTKDVRDRVRNLRDQLPDITA